MYLNENNLMISNSTNNISHSFRSHQPFESSQFQPTPQQQQLVATQYMSNNQLQIDVDPQDLNSIDFLSINELQAPLIESISCISTPERSQLLRPSTKASQSSSSNSFAEAASVKKIDSNQISHFQNIEQPFQGQSKQQITNFSPKSENCFKFFIINPFAMSSYF